MTIFRNMVDLKTPCLRFLKKAKSLGGEIISGMSGALSCFLVKIAAGPAVDSMGTAAVLTWLCTGASCRAFARAVTKYDDEVRMKATIGVYHRFPANRLLPENFTISGLFDDIARR
jgi:hypothetical protein